MKPIYVELPEHVRNGLVEYLVMLQNEDNSLLNVCDDFADGRKIEAETQREIAWAERWRRSIESKDPITTSEVLAIVRRIEKFPQCFFETGNSAATDVAIGRAIDTTEDARHAVKMAKRRGGAEAATP